MDDEGSQITSQTFTEVMIEPFLKVDGWQVLKPALVLNGRWPIQEGVGLTTDDRTRPASSGQNGDADLLRVVAKSLAPLPPKTAQEEQAPFEQKARVVGNLLAGAGQTFAAAFRPPPIVPVRKVVIAVTGVNGLDGAMSKFRYPAQGTCTPETLRERLAVDIEARLHRKGEHQEDARTGVLDKMKARLAKACFIDDQDSAVWTTARMRQPSSGSAAMARRSCPWKSRRRNLSS